MCGYYVIDYFVKLNTAQVQVLTYRFSTKYKQVVIQVTLICFLDSNLKINFDFVLNGIESFVFLFISLLCNHNTLFADDILHQQSCHL